MDELSGSKSFNPMYWKVKHDLFLAGNGPKSYDLFIRVIDGKTQRPLPETQVGLHTWNHEKEEFIPEATFQTNRMGIVDIMNLSCSDGKMITVSKPEYLTQTFRFRPTHGRHVKKFFRLWKPLDSEELSAPEVENNKQRRLRKLY